VSLGSLLRKELHWSRRNALALAFVLLVLPGFLAYTSVAFETVVPRDAPVAVVPEGEAVTAADLQIIRGGLATVSDPVVIQTQRAATAMLRRETVYAVVRVPPDITEAGAPAAFRLTVDGSIVPFEEPSEVIRAVMAARLDAALPADVTVERRVLAPESSLSEYLLPVFLMTVVALFAFTYVPYNLAREAAVLDRLRVESSLEAVVGAKLLYFGGLLLVPVAVFQAVAALLGYTVAVLAPGTVLALALTFVPLAAISTAVMLLLRFGTLGRFVNVVLLLGTVALSGLVYPVGYFSPLRKAVVRVMPTHYAMIVARSTMLKGVGLAPFADWLGWLCVFALATLLALELSVIYYQRTA
jgi:ABC-2 type transport system permease protein